MCGRTRPDARISVYSTEVTVHGIVMTQNVRYCNDRQICIDGAKKVDWLSGPAHYELKKDA